MVFVPRIAFVGVPIVSTMVSLASKVVSPNTLKVALAVVLPAAIVIVEDPAV